MASEIKLIAQPRNGSGAPKTFDYKPGGKHPAEANQFYKIVVDGKEELPVGTKIARKGNSVVFDFPDGTNFTLDDWCTVSDSRITDLINGQAYSAGDATYVPAKDIDSGTCVIWAGAGQAGAVLGDSSVAPATATTAAPAGGDDDHTAAAIIGGILGLGAIAALSHDSGGGGESAPGKPTLDLAAASDTGISNEDNLTRDSTPTIQGKANAGANVTLYEGDRVVGTAVADSKGNWTIPIGTELAEGEHRFTATQTNAGGTGPRSDELLVTVDVTPPDINGAADQTVAEDFTPFPFDSNFVAATDLHNANITNVRIISAGGFNVSNDGNDNNDDVQIVTTATGIQQQLTSSGADKFGSIVTEVEVQDDAGNISTKQVTFTVTPVNDAPVNSAPSSLPNLAFSTPSVTKVDGLILSVSDPDEAPGPDNHKIDNVLLTVDDGTLSVTNPGGLTIGGQNSQALQLTGNQASINAALDTIQWLANPVGQLIQRNVKIDMTTTDQQGLTDTDSIIIPLQNLTGGSVGGGGGGAISLNDVFSGGAALTTQSTAPSSSSISSLIGNLQDQVPQSA